MPDWKPEILRRLAPLKLAPTREAEIAEEVAQHLEDRYQELLAGGATEGNACRVAVEELKDEDLLARELRRVEREAPQEPIVLGSSRAHNFLAGLWQDLRYGLRQMRRNPGFAAVAVVTLALGIGANTAVFSLVDAVMLKNLPVKSPEQLVLLQWATPQRQPPPNSVLNSLRGDMWRTRTGGMASTSFSYPAFQEFRSHNGVFSDVFGFQSAGRLTMNLSGRASLASGEMVTGDYFSGLGILPVLGRAITDADEKAGAPPVAVISYGLWKNQFGGSSSVAGKAVTLNGIPFTIVGVAPPQFFGVEPGSKLDLWVPDQTTKQPPLLQCGFDLAAPDRRDSTSERFS
jgi:MacB-like periplasmic core domain